LNVTPPPGLTLEPTILPGSTSISDSAGALLPSTTLSTAISAPQTYTQIINNAYLADPFPVQPPSSGPNVSRGDIAAIILSSLGGMATLLSWLFWRKRRASSGFQKKGYTIAWIAPLEMDALAARNMLDHIHKAVKFPAGQGVDFIYTVGDINGHNIVIATFPSGHSAGVGAAASLARDIKAKFPNVLLTLLVGVAGGIPDFSQAPPWDIRRGDVLVAEGEEGGPCVISYGSGTETAQNLVVAKTSAMLFGAVIGQMKGAGEDRWTSFRTHYQKLLTEDCNNKFQDPGQDNDRFLTTPQGLAAGPANPLPMQRRRRPDNERVQVWYGKLASGDDLRENPQQRRQLKERYDIKGFETGAASVMDVFEKVGVIRGVCDYGDGQQTREWQPYAAATAAAYAKAVLCNIDPDTDLNRTEEQGAQPEGGSGKNPGEPATVEIELLPTPKISLKISLRRLFGWLND
jgi:nucleoside phosphorylase